MSKWLLWGILTVKSLFALQVYDVGLDWKESMLQESFMGLIALRDEVEAYKGPYDTFLYKIKDGCVSVEATGTVSPGGKERKESLLASLEKLLMKRDLPDMMFLVHMGDGMFEREKWDQVPIFTFSKRLDQHAAILMPDFEMLAGYEYLDVQTDHACIKYRWPGKLEKALWRGSTTGGDFSRPEWRELPRSRLVLLSKEHRSHVDAKFTAHCQGADTNQDFLNTVEPYFYRMTVEEHAIFKYLLDVDGNACTYSRLYWILRSNSTPFKLRSLNHQWYYKGLVPYKHYVPVKADCSDLLELVDWARAHDDIARQIAQESRAFAIEHLNHEAVYDYFYDLLMRYSEIYID